MKDVQSLPETSFQWQQLRRLGQSSARARHFVSPSLTPIAGTSIFVFLVSICGTSTFGKAPSLTSACQKPVAKSNTTTVMTPMLPVWLRRTTTSSSQVGVR